MPVSSHLFEAFLECRTKCWLRSRAEPASGNAYADWARAQSEAYYVGALKRLVAMQPESSHWIAPPISKTLKDATWRLSSDIRLSANDLESRLQAVERIPAEGRARTDQFVPYRFEFANKLTKNHKLSLAFDALVLSEAVGREVSLGKITHGDSHATLKVKLSSLVCEVKKRIKDITALLANNTPPDVVLNRHCGQCEFQARCRKQATDKDELSLLSGMSEKERKKLHDKGIFTVTQLSYTFRPRRRSKRHVTRPEKYHHSLKALAIREQKIHIVGRPQLKIEGTPVFLDVEGLPDRDFYYLIGVRLKNMDGIVQHRLWADDNVAEKTIWLKFLSIISEIERPVLIHYGSFEATFLKKMCDRYGGPEGLIGQTAIKSPINLLSVIYAQICFPVHYNGLKEIAKYLGFNWADPLASGLQSLVWRYQWEQSRAFELREKLIRYNNDDCEALALVTAAIGQYLDRGRGTNHAQPWAEYRTCRFSERYDE